MSRRLVISAAGGMRISAPGYDALTTSEDHLLFSTTASRIHLMQIGSGTFILVSGEWISFGQDVGAAPLVRCGLVGRGGVGYPVAVTVLSTGFYAYAAQAPNGAYPAEGQLCTWVAFMRSRH